jgi:hypothetical protein
MVLSIVTVLGIVGGIILGFVGLRSGTTGELVKICAIACFAMAAAGVLGLWVQHSARVELRRRTGARLAP